MTAPEVQTPTPSPRPFQRFFNTESAGGILLMFCGVVAISIANSPWAAAFADFWHTPVAVVVGSHPLELSLHGWINDGLMAVFFLLVGLEIKRELVAGELASPRQAALPIAGAIGGMVVPAAFYALVTAGTPGIRGWGIPMATDIAFALGTLSLIAPRAPTGAKIFLTALAIVDDMGAVLVIALFYTGTVAWGALAAAGATLAVLIGLNLSGVRRLTPYLSLGVILWFFVHASGVHATIAGVLLAFTIPTRTRINALQFSDKARTLLDEFERTETGDFLVLTSKGQQEALFALERASEEVTEPLLRLEHALHSFAAFFVMPVFALANAGVPLTGPIGDAHVAAGVAIGLVLGKPVGITLAAFLAVRLGLASLPRQVSWLTLHACGWLGGIGFTMSLFIATLAFGVSPLLDAAKIGVIGGSLFAGLAAAFVMRLASPPPARDEAAADAARTA
ncbi:MAG: Na+/H+ antiporter NhaA [Acidobacteriota bacterium]